VGGALNSYEPMDVTWNVGWPRTNECFNCRETSYTCL